MEQVLLEIFKAVAGRQTYGSNRLLSSMINSLVSNTAQAGIKAGAEHLFGSDKKKKK